MIIKRPLVTEKNNTFSDKQTYVFEVDRKANKEEIRAFVERHFGVQVKNVRTAVCRGRSKRTSRGIGRVPYWKKAIVRLKEGEKITVFEGG